MKVNEIISDRDKDITLYQQLYHKICDEQEKWTKYKKEAYNVLFTTTKNVSKIEI